MSETTALSADNTPAKRGGMSDDKLLSIARKRLNVVIAATSESRADELNDLKFSAGSSDNNWQWPDEAKMTRKDPGGVYVRPMLTINQLPQHIKQVSNDMRQNRPTGKVIGANSDADSDVAEIYNGLVRHIEYQSDADIVYDTAGESAVTIGEGYWRILTRYEDETSFNQEIYLIRIRNPFSVYLDPSIQDPCGQDARYGFILSDLTREEFDETYPDANPISALEQSGVGDEGSSSWIDEDMIRVAEYFFIEVSMEKLYLFPEGKTAFEGSKEFEVYQRELGDPIKSRMSKREQVKWVKLNGYEILERGDWAGSKIPIVKVVGNEVEIEGEIYTSGIVRNAKDAQRMYNYHSSNEVEMIALAPKAPFIGYSGQFKGHEKKWNTANTLAHPYLEVNAEVLDGNGNSMPLPQRVMPPMAQQGIIAAKQAAADDIKKATGQYNASLGQTSNERSGKAIIARQHEGDTSTYHYGDNLGRAVRASTRQIVQLIPKIYDTARVARIIGEDGNTSMVHLDPTQAAPVTQVQDPTDPRVIIKKIYNPSVGKYDVAVVTGPGYATKRQQALDAMVQLLQNNPNLWSVAGDLIVKNMDWPGAQELSKRLAKTIDPKLTADEDTSPALQQAKMQLEQLTQQYQHATMMLQNVQHSFEAQDLKIKQQEADIKGFDAQTKRISAVSMAARAAADDNQTMPDQIVQIATDVVNEALSSGQVPGQQEPAPQAPPLDPNKVMLEDSKHALQGQQHAHELAMAQLQGQQAQQAAQAQQQAPTAPEGAQ